MIASPSLRLGRPCCVVEALAHDSARSKLNGCVRLVSRRTPPGMESTVARSRGCGYQSDADAILAPSAIAASLAQVIPGSMARKLANVAKPQSLPAITFSRPTSCA